MRPHAASIRGVRRTTFLSALVALLLVGTVVSAAAAGQKAPPRGVLTNVEYREFLAVQKAQKQRSKGRTLTQIVRNDCKALTNVSRITATQHAECVAGSFFFVRLDGFTAGLSRCAKKPSRSAKIGCIGRAANVLDHATRHFISRDAASTRAARARGITGRCLDYLILTPRQARPVHKLVPAVKGFVHALRAGNLLGLLNSTKRLSAVVSKIEKVFTGGSVAVCRHE